MSSSHSTRRLSSILQQLFHHPSSAIRTPFRPRLLHFSRPTPSLHRPHRRPYSTTPPTPPAKPSLSARLRTLSREYGWTAVGVYFALSALDFPFCFAAVRVIGVERIGYAEEAVVGAFWRVVEWVVPDAVDGGKKLYGEREGGKQGGKDGGKGKEEDGWGVREAQRATRRDDASIWTQLALAYAIHKSFIFLRVPLTAAILPKVVKTLRGWGYNIGKRPVKPAATSAAGSGTTTAAGSGATTAAGSGTSTTAAGTKAAPPKDIP